LQHKQATFNAFVAPAAHHEVTRATPTNRSTGEAQRNEALFIERMRPKIYWPSPWAEDTPEWLKEQIDTDRLAQLVKDGKTEMATYSEVVFYMMPLTQERPLDRDWVEIYCWAAKQVMGDKMPDDLVPKELNTYQKSELDRLRRWIWAKSVEATKKRGRLHRSPQIKLQGVEKGGGSRDVEHG